MNKGRLSGFWEKHGINFILILMWKKKTNNKTFWKTVKSIFSDKQVQSGKSTLVKSDEITDDDKEIGNIFNHFL